QVTTSCDGGRCVETMTPMGASCVVPGIEGSTCSTGDVDWGPCEPPPGRDPCTTTVGTETGRTTADACRAGACVPEGAGSSTSRSCEFIPLPQCFVTDAGEPEAGTDSSVGDTGPTDSGVPDSGAGTDSGAEDSGAMDSGMPDSSDLDSAMPSDDGGLPTMDGSDGDSGMPPADVGPTMDGMAGVDV
ncbi:MAG: hypothetical protein JRH11_10560, partial [Deltaproteobacteria bacterium]|nr:hypothetical protein [Deltaproteobacteria bacterium]